MNPHRTPQDTRAYFCALTNDGLCRSKINLCWRNFQLPENVKCDSNLLSNFISFSLAGFWFSKLFCRQGALPFRSSFSPARGGSEAQLPMKARHGEYFFSGCSRLCACIIWKRSIDQQFSTYLLIYLTGACNAVTNDFFHWGLMVQGIWVPSINQQLLVS